MARQRGEARIAWALLAPSLFGVVAFLVVPVLVVAWLGMQSWDLIGPRTFVGLDNVTTVAADGRFARSLLVTALFVVIVIPLQTALGLGAALLLHRDLPGSAAFRVIYLLPWICAPLVLGVVWRWVLAPTDGALNAVLGTRIEWLADPALALPSVAAVTVWTQAGYVALFFVAGLRAIPSTVLEAALLDGANRRQTFWRVTLPLLRPTTFFVLVTGVISSFQVFDSVYALTPNGGPQGVTDVVAGRIYYEAFENRAVGQAAVMALVLFVILVTVTLVQQRWFSRRTTYDLST
ncbi:carbohydrate ABC transporter permease [Pseudonocardia abyssalis]|uniref:Sugar ABC transporter permease n=1 Tax=Pseudonocardia abyssalis TaxID=2792008 RepID=A0ABS6UKW7_9PSEU|nr:sugar ABC transporter permease [Pseudonocardia abyssalis]MBW0116998.1 sugar ABC transporter permease [Pseudonocardia abyssalis]MBW0132905.1 sugar ABC transporter permease [Pseudonocardia abyssalis]